MNDFDFEFENIEAREQHVELKPSAIPYLRAWVSQNKEQLPSGLQLRCLGILTKAPERILVEWIRVNVLNSSAQQALAPRGLRQSRARCLDSNPRYHKGQGHISKPKPFECTNRCGQSFLRKGDWDRHERLNFEEWKCPKCPEVLSRWNHLHNHLKRAHKSEENRRNVQPHHFLKVQQRPCGFCGCSYVDWRQWLSHVAAHFEGKLLGGVRHVSEWNENLQPVVEGQERPGSDMDLAVDFCDSQLGSFMNGAGYSPFSPSNNPESFGGNAEGYEIYCPQIAYFCKKTLFGMGFDTRRNSIPKDFAITVKGDITTINYSDQGHRDEKPPPSTVAEMRYNSSYQPFLGNIVQDEEDCSLVPSMTMPGITRRLGVRFETHSESSMSTSCGDVSSVLSHRANPGVQWFAGAMPRSRDFHRHSNRYIMDSYYLGRDSTEDPWTVCTPPRQMRTLDEVKVSFFKTTCFRMSRL